MDKIEDLLVNKGLYDEVDLLIDDLEEMEKYLTKNQYAGNNIDCYCIHCETKRVFEFCDSEVHDDAGIMRMMLLDESVKTRKPKRQERFDAYLNKRYALSYRCTRDRKHSVIFDLVTTDSTIVKVGQYPSVADLIIPEIAKYKSVLGEQYREFSKAIGLFAHGIGIGSFVYLRRIIENLVFDKYEQVADEIGVSKEEFESLKFDIKIEKLKGYLPTILVANKNVYGIVSKGIHELSEEECRSMFPYIRAGIELILDDLLADKERIRKEKMFEKFVAQKTGELKKEKGK